MDCGVTKVAGPSSCRQCGLSEEHCCVLSYAGCGSCRPEAQLRGKIRHGPAASVLARSAMAFAMLCPLAMGLQSCSSKTGPSGHADTGADPRRCGPSPEPVTRAGDKEISHPVFHIIEEPGGIRHLTECEVPTEEYNTARLSDLARSHPGLSP